MRRLMRKCVLGITAALLTPIAAGQPEYFGEFLDRLKGTFDIEAKPRPKFKIETDFRFKDPNGLQWVAPAGTTVDGASIPQALWSIIGGPFEGAYINASVIHDHYCTTRERTAHDTHRNFYYGMRAAQVPGWQAQLMHWAVSTFGPSWTLSRRVVMEQVCTPTTIGQAASCKSVGKVVVALVPLPAVDLSDPDVLAVAVGKTNAVARTLLTSNGKVLDVTTQGPVNASLENIQASANAYRHLFASKNFTNSPEKLGLLSQASSALLSETKPWVNNRIPRLQDAVVLTPQTVKSVEGNLPFKLDSRSKDLLGETIDLRKLETVTRLPNRTQ